MQECADKVMAVSMWEAGSRARGMGRASVYMLLGISMKADGKTTCAVVKEVAYMRLGTSTKVSCCRGVKQVACTCLRTSAKVSTAASMLEKVA